MKKLTVLILFTVFSTFSLTAQIMDDPRSWVEQGKINQENGKLDTAISNYNRAIAINPKYTPAWLYRGLAYYEKGDLDKAIEDYNSAIAINPNYAAAFVCRGLAFGKKGEIDRVIEDYSKAISIDSNEVFLYILRGNAYSIKSEINHAINDYNKAILLDPDNFSAYNSRGLLFYDNGEYERAIADFNKAISIDPNYIAAWNNRGLVYSKKGDHEKAITDYSKSISLDPGYDGAWVNRGTAYLEKGELDLAIADFTKAIALNPKSYSPFQGRGEAYFKKNMASQAISDYKKTIELAEKSSNMLDTFLLSWEFAGYLYKNYPYLNNTINGNSNDKQLAAIACEAVGKSIERAEKARSSLGSRGTGIMAEQLFQYYVGVDLEATFGTAEKAFGYSEALRSRGFLEQMGIEAALNLPGIPQSDVKEVRRLLASIESLQHLQSKLNPQVDAEQYSDAGIELTKTEAALQTLENKIAKRFPRYAELRSPKTATIAQAKSFAGKDRVILEYVIWDSSVEFKAPTSVVSISDYQERPTVNSYCLVITNKGVTAVRLDPAYDYAVAINNLRNGIISQSSIALLEKDRNGLFNALIKPVLPHIPANIKELIIVPDSNLGHLPFDVLRENSGSADLGEKYRISLSPSISVSVLAAKLNIKQNLPVMAFGGALYSSKGTSVGRGQRGFAVAAGTQELSWYDLPGTETEVKNLQKLVDSSKDMQAVLGKNASEAQIKRLSARGELAKYPILHFACHGYFNENDQGRSGIVLSEVSDLIYTGEDGYLTIPEIVLLNLKAKMVLLSACETGLSTVKRGDGMVGMARAFLVSGAKNVGVSLWSIDDEATTALMTSVYSKVLKEKKSFKEAYYLAKKEFRSDSKWSHPFYWAAFTMYE